MMQDRDYRFDFALSFAGPERHLAKSLRDGLAARDYRVFYDRDFEHEMLGRNGADYLREVYSSQARYCIVVLSESYEQSAWTQLEKESIQSRQIRGEDGTLIPIRSSKFLPSWLPETRIYFDLAIRQISELLEILGRLVRSEQIALKDVRSQDDLYRALPGTTWRKKNDIEHVVFREGSLVCNNIAGHATWRENYYQIGSAFRSLTIRWTVDGYVARCQFSSDFSEFIELDNPN
ncbi:hypothetical protein AC249_AIPGENE14964, partial [Exaiptasia diaphana]